MEVLLLIGLSVVGVYMWKKHSAKQTIENALNLVGKQPGFTNDEYLISADNSTILAIDKTQKKLCVWNKGTIKVFASGSVISCEILVNDMTKSSKSILSVWGRYYSKKLIFGEMEGVVAALTGPEKQQKLITSVALKLMFNDFDMPFVIVSLLESNGSTYYDFDLAFQWEGYIRVLMS